MSKYEQKLSSTGSTDQILLGMFVIGIISFAVGLYQDTTHTWFTYLIYNFLFFGLGVGAMLFLSTHYLASSGWFVLIRRIPEAFADYLKIGCLTTLVILAGLTHLYPWTDHALMESNHFLHHKTGYFSTPFFIVRMLAMFAVLVFFSSKMLRNSIKQDSEGGKELRMRQKPLSALYLVLFAPLFTIFAVDMLKSLQPTWFSTMWGVYVFVGFCQTSIAVAVITLFFLKRSGYLKEVTADHVHDLGKYMFGWSIFWGYIGVSQYLLIWYANLPEETTFYLAREAGSWTLVSLLLPLFKFALPFLLLLPRAAKRNLNYVAAVAVIVVFSEWLDLTWMVIPVFSPEGFTIGWQDFGLFIGFTGLFAFWIRRFFKRNNLVPAKDPFLHESEKHHVVYA